MTIRVTFIIHLLCITENGESISKISIKHLCDWNKNRTDTLDGLINRGGIYPDGLISSLANEIDGLISRG